MKTCFLSIDVEFLSSRSDKENKNTKGIKELNNILNIFEKHNANATLFTTGEVLEEYKELAKQWAEKYEIACHNYNHISIDNLTQEQREKELDQFKNLYKVIFNKQPIGYRAPRNIIDNEQISLLQEKGFLYDSSVFPRYPWPKKYAGYKGRAPKKPYHPSKKDYKKQGDMKILEIPESSAAFNIPMVGTWLRKLTPRIYKAIFSIRKPDFIGFSMHSWDGVEFQGRSSKNSGEVYLKQLDNMLNYLKNKGYKFKSAEEIYKENEL